METELKIGDEVEIINLSMEPDGSRLFSGIIGHKGKITKIIGDHHYLEPTCIGNSWRSHNLKKVVESLKSKELIKDKWYFGKATGTNWIFKFKENVGTIAHNEACCIDSGNKYGSGHFSTSEFPSLRLATKEEVLKYYPNEKFENDIIEYYEFIEYAGSFTHGKIYKCKNPLNLEATGNFTDDGGNSNGYSPNNHSRFRPSTKEAFDAQNSKFKVDLPNEFVIVVNSIEEFHAAQDYCMENSTMCNDWKNETHRKFSDSFPYYVLFSKSSRFCSYNNKNSFKVAKEINFKDLNIKIDTKEESKKVNLVGRYLKVLKDYCTDIYGLKQGDYLLFIKKSNDVEYWGVPQVKPFYWGAEAHKMSCFELMPEGFSPDSAKSGFIRDKWYKNLGISSDYIAKFKSLSSETHICIGDYINDSKRFYYNDVGTLQINPNTCEANLEEIQQYLPEGHPDKIIKETKKDSVMDKDKLLEEAKRRYPIGTKFKSLINKEDHIIREVKPFINHRGDPNPITWYFSENNIISSENGLYTKGINGESVCSNPIIYENGKWAEIVEESKESSKETWTPKVGEWIYFLTSYDGKPIGYVTRISDITSEKTVKESLGWIHYVEGGFRWTEKNSTFGYTINKHFRKAELHEIPKESDSINLDNFPEKWAIRGNIGISKEKSLIDYFNKTGQNKKSNYEFTTNHFYYLENYQLRGNRILPIGYTEISFEQFKARYLDKQSYKVKEQPFVLEEVSGFNGFESLSHLAECYQKPLTKEESFTATIKLLSKPKIVPIKIESESKINTIKQLKTIKINYNE